MGRRDPGLLRKGESLALRTEDVRFTSLFGAEAGVVVTGNMGVDEPACEKASEPLEWETAAEPGREVGVRLLSRDVDMPLDNRRNQVWD